ncbi:unnamed protein product [Rotaria magnacalcarata]|uniref:Peptidase M12B domain-containing protein n=1 Tax=Rotaria magnacalcarata TaxID=392030 RepID=A0A8S2QL24_9BILA|nr:unnamed protein product [Rotaria magnacalcarata]
MNQTRSKQSFHYDYIVKHNGSILEQTFVSIEWRNNRERRAAQKSPIYTSNRFDKRYFTNTADHIMTFTRLDLIDGAGSAYVSVMLTITHELGHMFGSNHDETENECNDPHIQYIMTPESMKTADHRQVTQFSPCSIKRLNNLFNNTKTTCWKKKIIRQLINRRQQCQLQYGLEAIPFISVTYNKSQTLYEENVFYCEECKKHLIPQCGELLSECSIFVRCCQMKFVRIDGRSAVELCPDTCGKCRQLPRFAIITTVTTETI